MGVSQQSKLPRAAGGLRTLPAAAGERAGLFGFDHRVYQVLPEV
eukprot:CAMPEP_0180662938 /NCGR_PEP_ID=MMETSP1037_2-20121125/59665_1 /TAXON_ID=632150 /ORGANISM="Azadinium spinosum, Strain 3D9" /LENGTH=43 /DNA_ID= /DNA_START= /DNA_END= /DNA_ORIENTATION=